MILDACLCFKSSSFLMYTIKFESEVHCNFVKVSRRVSELVLENHPAYQTELQRVMELQECLESATEICFKGRR